MSLDKLLEKIRFESCVTGDCGQLHASTVRNPLEADAVDLVVMEDAVADLDGVVQSRAAGHAEVPIRTGILRRG